MWESKNSISLKSQTGLQHYKAWMTNRWISTGVGKVLERIWNLQPQHKLLFDEEPSKLLDQRKQAKLKWVQNPSQVNADNL
jgi:hypothetical protein